MPKAAYFSVTTSGVDYQEQESTLASCFAMGGLELPIMSSNSLRISFDITNEALETYFDETTYKLSTATIDDEVFKNILKSLDDFLKVSSIANIKDRVKDLSGEAESYLIKDELLAEIINSILNKIAEYTFLKHIRYSIRIYISKDREIEDAEEIVISLILKGQSFDNTMKVWEEIGHKTEGIFKEMIENKTSKELYEEAAHLKKIDQKLAIEVKR